MSISQGNGKKAFPRCVIKTYHVVSNWTSRDISLLEEQRAKKKHRVVLSAKSLSVAVWGGSW